MLAWVNPIGKLPIHQCERCQHQWHPRTDNIPIRCPKCKSPYWQTKPKARIKKALLILFLMSSWTPAMAEEPVGPPPKVTRLSQPTDAQALALADLKRVPVVDQPFQWYAWHQDGRIETAKMFSLTINYVSRANTIYRPVVIKDGNVLLSRCDLRRLAPRPEDLAEWLLLREEFQFDPSFSTIITKDAIEQVIRSGTKFQQVIEIGKSKIHIHCKPYKIGEEEFDSRWVAAIRFRGRHLDDKVMEELETLTGSAAPIVESRYFTFRALSTIKDSGLYELLFGGLYYELSGIKKAKAVGKRKATDEDLLFEQVGIGDVDKGLTAEAIFERLRGDQRTAVFRSKVTAKPRRVDVLPSLSGRGNQGFLIVTHDLRDRDVDTGTHPLMNLAQFKDAAREDIFTKANGLHGFALFDGDGKLQDEAPPDVVKDHTIPSPHTARLAGAISCIRCHGTDGSDGLKPLVNDVQRLLKGPGALDIFGDISKGNLNKTIPDTLDRLTGQYAGSPDKVLRRGREDYIEAILRATGPWDDDKEAQIKIGLNTAKRYEEMWVDWLYESVDARKALREWGYEVNAKDAPAVLREYLTPDKASEVGGITPEDVRLGALRMGLEITRMDYSLVQSTGAARIRQREARAKEKK